MKKGCHPSNFIDMTGWKMWEHGVADSRIIVICEAAKTNSKKVRWKCMCACGNPRVFVVDGTGLRFGNTLSCGCIKKERCHKTHGESKSKLYDVWCAMIKRCNNPHYHDYRRYGGRGINIASEWRTYEPFRDWAIANGYKEGLELDRIDNDGNYCRDNCRWVTHQEQCRNRSSNVWIQYMGRKWSVAECSKRTGIAEDTIRARVKNGWTPEEIFSVPCKTRRKKGKYYEKN